MVYLVSTVGDSETKPAADLFRQELVKSVVQVATSVDLRLWLASCEVVTGASDWPVDIPNNTQRIVRFWSEE